MDPHPNPPPTQLLLPLEPTGTAIRFPQPLAEVSIRPRTLWRRLSSDLQEQVRQTMLRICQEVLDDPPQR